MTEQIKSALEVLGTYDMSEDNDDTEFKDSIALAIRSLKAWEEVIEELKNMREIIWQDTDNDSRIVRANAWDKIETLNKAIEIINQKLAEIEE